MHTCGNLKMCSKQHMAAGEEEEEEEEEEEKSWQGK